MGKLQVFFKSHSGRRRKQRGLSPLSKSAATSSTSVSSALSRNFPVIQKQATTRFDNRIGDVDWINNNSNNIFHLQHNDHLESCSDFTVRNLDTRIEADARDLDSKFAQLAGKFRRVVNLYGIVQDVGLLFLADDTSARASTLQQPPAGREGNPDLKSSSNCDIDSENQADGDTRSPHSGGGSEKRRRRVFIEILEKLFCVALVLLANISIVHIFTGHIKRELWQLDAKISAFKTNSTGDEIGANIQLDQSTGWLVLKNFLENFRRHMSRLFAFLMTITWLKCWHEFEMLFVDCRRYYVAFHTSMALNVSDLPSEQVAVESFSFSPTTQSATMRRVELRARQSKLLSENRSFYQVVKRRVEFALWFPIIQFVFNVSSISMFASSTRRRHGNWTSPAFFECHGESCGDNVAAHYLPENSTLTNTTLGNIIESAFENFDSFHLSIHTSFHSLDYRIGQTLPTNTSANGDYDHVTVLDSALFCLGELFMYSMYVHGSRIVAATCLSIVLNMHHRCISSFNNQLMNHIKRSKNKPMSDGNLVSLLKQYDMISMMHEKIERTFRWSVILWFMLMFINCLMQIFSFTESTSAYVVSGSMGATTGGTPGQPQVQTPRRDISIISSPTSSLAIMFLRVTSIVFVCYSPLMIYYEAFKIESASNRAEQLVMLLARRQDDALAQSIEPAIFEPLNLNIGGYFELNKRSVSAFLGAIVTFSVMFIELRTKSMLTNSNQAAAAKRFAANNSTKA